MERREGQDTVFSLEIYEIHSELGTSLAHSGADAAKARGGKTCGGRGHDRKGGTQEM